MARPGPAVATLVALLDEAFERPVLARPEPAWRAARAPRRQGHLATGTWAP